ncbi:ADP-ribosylglycohydrolase family protein [Amycolatopsis roodepoortensis]|uniref:ADP-ribosylglycohydrolase family protein n=1 Tax=Amycolatopsis roodepoortensis TaxID=700274 RepID=UPI00353133BC
MFLGAAVGDALGWPQEIRGNLIGGQKERDRAVPRLEFRDWTRHAGQYARRYRDPVRAGEYSDDTQLLLATARCCLAGEAWWTRLTEVELPAWPFYQRGGGGAVLTAASSWAERRPPWRGQGSAQAPRVATRYRNAGANGVAMRISPHVLFAGSPDELIRRVFLDGIATHGHPRALVGALSYAFVLRSCLSSTGTHGFGANVHAAAVGLVDVANIVPLLPEGWGSASEIDHFASTWREANEEMEQLLGIVSDSLGQGAMSDPESTLEKIGCTDKDIGGAGTVSAAGAVYLASRFAARPHEALLSAAYLSKADTDTLASLTAGILGALHGPDWLGPLASTVQDAGYLSDMAARCVTQSDLASSWPTKRPRTLSREIREALVLRKVAGGEFPDGRYYHVGEFVLLSEEVLRTKLRLDDGQTALIDTPLRSTSATNRTSDALREKSVTSKASDAVSNKAASSSTSSESSVAGSGISRQRVEALLAARNLAKTASFYARLIGRDIPVSAGMAEINSRLLMFETPDDTPIDADLVSINVVVDDFSSMISRLGLEGSELILQGGVFEVRDPDGRIVRVSQSTEHSAS